MDLYSRRIVGWFIGKRMTTDLISKAMVNAYALRRQHNALILHNNESQYTIRRYRQLLKNYDIRVTMGEVLVCWDNAVVECFFCSLKHD
jgi:putative transposase